MALPRVAFSNSPPTPISSAQLVEGMLTRYPVNSVDRARLDTFLQEASVTIGDASLSPQEARLAIYNFYSATGFPVEAVRAEALVTKSRWPVDPALGFNDVDVSAPQAMPSAARKLLRGVRSAHRAERNLASAVASGLIELTPANGTDGFSTRRFTAGTNSGTRVFLRATQPNTDIGHLEANRSNNAVNILAHQFGAEDFTLPSILIPRPAELNGTVQRETLMVLPFAGDGFMPAGTRGGQLTNPNASRISEKHRMVGALISYLTQHNDARPNNTLVDKRGAAKFIDNDNVFGRSAWFAQYGAPQNDYFKGRALAYASDLSRYDAHPDWVKAVIDGLCSLDAGQIAALYGITEAEADTIRIQAQRVQEFGLEGAIARFPIAARR